MSVWKHVEACVSTCERVEACVSMCEACVCTCACVSMCEACVCTCTCVSVEQDPGTGNTYYYNKDTGVTQWTIPQEVLELQGAAVAARAWMEIKDPTTGKVRHFIVTPPSTPPPHIVLTGRKGCVRGGGCWGEGWVVLGEAWLRVGEGWAAFGEMGGGGGSWPCVAWAWVGIFFSSRLPGKGCVSM